MPKWVKLLKSHMTEPIKPSPNAIAFGRIVGRMWSNKPLRYSTLVFLLLLWLISRFFPKDTPPPVVPTANSILSTQNQTAISTIPTQEQIRAVNKAQLEEIDLRLKNNREKLRKYYATIEQVKQSNKDHAQLLLISEIFGASLDKADMPLSKRAKTLALQVAEQTRILYASSMEENFMKNGLNITVNAKGAKGEQLKITYALMSQPLVYKFENEMKFQEQAGRYGFKKIIYTNGFESSLGQTWTVDLRELKN